MEISAIIPGVKLDSRDARQSSQLPLRVLLAAFDRAGIAATQRDLALNALATWGSVEARVIERRPGNEHLLAIAGGRISLGLSEAHEAGEVVLLSLDAKLQDPHFGVVRGADLSPLSMLLGRLTVTSATAELPAATPLSETPDQADELAAGLKNSIAQSGLFYESHLASWAEGKRPLESLFAEPQAKMPAEERPGEGMRADAMKHPVAENLAPLVRRQLDLLDNQMLLWRGEVWPGQSAALEIHPDRRTPQAPAAPPDTGAWTTRLRMQLPILGTIEALISVDGKHAGIRLSSDQPATVSTLAEARADLVAALSQNGIGVGQFSVKPNA
jgi:hypothetical protein